MFHSTPLSFTDSFPLRASLSARFWSHEEDRDTFATLTWVLNYHFDTFPTLLLPEGFFSTFLIILSHLVMSVSPADGLTFTGDVLGDHFPHPFWSPGIEVCSLPT